MLNLKLALFIFPLTKYYIIVKECKTIIKAYTCYELYYIIVKECKTIIKGYTCLELFPLFNCLLLFKLISMILVCRFRIFKNTKICYKELKGLFYKTMIHESQ